MAATVLYTFMSLDGFIAGPNVRNGLGDGGQGLHDWMFPAAEGVDFEAATGKLTGANRQVWTEVRQRAWSWPQWDVRAHPRLGRITTTGSRSTH